MPNFNLVNQPSLDKILKAKVFIHSDGQLRAIHLILGYTPISKSFQALKCDIKSKDLHLHWTSVAAPGFLATGPITEGVFTTTPILKGIPKVGASFSHPIIKEEKEEKEEGEEIVEVSEFEDEFKVFNQPLSPEASTSDLGPPFIA